MDELHIYQKIVADILNRIGGKNIECFNNLSTGTRYVFCSRNEEKWIFSFSEKNPKQVSYIFTINNVYRLVSYQFQEIMLEFQKLISDQAYIIPRNEHAIRLSKITGLS